MLSVNSEDAGGKRKLKGFSPEIEIRSGLADAFMMAEGNFVGSVKQVSSNPPPGGLRPSHVSHGYDMVTWEVLQILR